MTDLSAIMSQNSLASLNSVSNAGATSTSALLDLVKAQLLGAQSGKDTVQNAVDKTQNLQNEMMMVDSTARVLSNVSTSVAHGFEVPESMVDEFRSFYAERGLTFSETDWSGNQKVLSDYQESLLSQTQASINDVAAAMGEYNSYVVDLSAFGNVASSR